jgi:short-subunit dehydrogenase
MSGTALVTGASSGIGEQFARATVAPRAVKLLVMVRAYRTPAPNEG